MTTTQDRIEPGANIIDLRDVTERVDELREARDSFVEDCIIQTSCQFCGQDIEGCRSDEDWRDRGGDGACAVATEADGTPRDHEPTDEALTDTEYERGRWADENTEDAAELAALETLLDELRGNGGNHQWDGDWYPGSLIADGYFETYARELAEDIGAINRDIGWPACHIDWEAATDALKGDYSQVEYGGYTYWYR